MLTCVRLRQSKSSPNEDSKVGKSSWASWTISKNPLPWAFAEYFCGLKVLRSFSGWTWQTNKQTNRFCCQLGSWNFGHQLTWLMVSCLYWWHTTDKWTRGFTVESLKQSYFNSPSFFTASVLPFKIDRGVFEKICLDGPVYDLFEGLEVSSVFRAL